MSIDILIHATDVDVDAILAALRAYKGRKAHVEACEDVARMIERQRAEQVAKAPKAKEEAARIVRCKDCAKDGLTTCPICYIEKQTLQFVNHDPNFYCGAGERR